ncbi:hypothetical protein GQ53DRAFT_754669 [Thozetella sp. PMI_491]|nr:hypothetical protein GQ53DRAFT_754669 [Thozetella sp. PMI_491]
MACSTCHTRKIKCDLPANGGGPCTNCQTAGYQCRPHRRKRRRYFSPAASPPASSVNGHDVSIPIGSLEDTVSASQGFSPNDSHVTPEGREPREPSAIPVEVTPLGADLSTNPVVEKAYVGRTEVLGKVQFDETLVTEAPQDHSASFSAVDAEVLRLHRISQLPSAAERKRLVNHFLDSCWQWTPIVDPAWLHDLVTNGSSRLLLYAVCLAGSRVSTEEAMLCSEDFFRKARALFFYHHEPSTLLSVVAAIILQWWSPTGPEQVSQSNSGFWIHISMSLAYQMGLHKEPKPGPHASLRRRIWWSLVCRDILISVGVGRPRTINLDESDVLPPTIRDFPRPDAKAQLFVAYVEICQILGGIVQCRRHNSLSAAQKRTFESALYQWIRELPPELRLYREGDPEALNTYSVGSRQLHVSYFVALIILSGSENSHSPAAASLVAASFVAGIYADIDQRSDVRHLGPIYAFHALATALSLLQAFKYETVAEHANRDFLKIFNVLQKLSKKWGSAQGLLRPLQAAKRSAEAQPKSRSVPEPMPPSTKGLFREFGPSLCSLWHLYSEAPTGRTPTEVPPSTYINAPDGVALESASTISDAHTAVGPWDYRPTATVPEPEGSLFLEAQHDMEYQTLDWQLDDLLNSWAFSGLEV